MPIIAVARLRLRDPSLLEEFFTHGHDSERAAMIYQHEARGADSAITSAIDAHIATERERDGRR